MIVVYIGDSGHPRWGEGSRCCAVTLLRTAERSATAAAARAVVERKRRETSPTSGPAAEPFRTTYLSTHRTSVSGVIKVAADVCLSSCTTYLSPSNTQRSECHYSSSCRSHCTSLSSCKSPFRTTCHHGTLSAIREVIRWPSSIKTGRGQSGEPAGGALDVAVPRLVGLRERAGALDVVPVRRQQHHQRVGQKPAVSNF